MFNEEFFKQWVELSVFNSCFNTHNYFEHNNSRFKFLWCNTSQRSHGRYICLKNISCGAHVFLWGFQWNLWAPSSWYVKRRSCEVSESSWGLSCVRHWLSITKILSIPPFASAHSFIFSLTMFKRRSRTGNHSLLSTGASGSLSREAFRASLRLFLALNRCSLCQVDALSLCGEKN